MLTDVHAESQPPPPSLCSQPASRSGNFEIASSRLKEVVGRRSNIIKPWGSWWPPDHKVISCFCSVQQLMSTNTLAWTDDSLSQSICWNILPSNKIFFFYLSADKAPKSLYFLGRHSNHQEADLVKIAAGQFKSLAFHTQLFHHDRSVGGAQPGGLFTRPVLMARHWCLQRWYQGFIFFWRID